MTADLKAFPTIATRGGSSVVTGLEKLGQRVLLELLTPLGSMPYLEERGTSFVAQLQRTARTEADVLITFSAAKISLEKNLSGEESASDPNNERYADANIGSIAIADTELVITLDVTSLANSTTSVTLPALTISL